LISGIVSNKIGTKKTMFFCFMIGGLFGTAIIYVDPLDTTLIVFCLLLTKFGVSSALNLCFLVTAEYFPS
jgi:MFS family permease